MAPRPTTVPGEGWRRGQMRVLLRDAGPPGETVEGLALGLVFGTPRFSALPPWSAFEDLPIVHLAVAGWDRETSAVTSLSGIEALSWLRSLDLSGCEALSDLSPLANLTQLQSLNLSGCEALSDLSPLANLTQLPKLDVSQLPALREVSPLAQCRSLTELDLQNCERLALVGSLAALPALRELSLAGSENVRDLERLVEAPALVSLSFNRFALRDGVMLALATRRGDADLDARTAAMIDSFELTETADLHARRLVAAFARLGAATPAELLQRTAAAFRARDRAAANVSDTIAAKTWERFFEVAIALPDPTFRAAFETALDELPHAEAERILAAALLALADAPEPARAWALALGRRGLAPLPGIPARAVAPAAAVFFHAHRCPAEVEAWLEKGTVQGFAAWRDRVHVALARRALRLGDVHEARRQLALVETPDRQDEVRALLAAYLAAQREFREAAETLDAMVSAALRAEAAAEVLDRSPALASDEHAALSLLLALDAHPERLAAVVAHAVEQSPESPLAAALARAFSPLRSEGLGEALETLLGHPAIAECTRPRQLAALRARCTADPAVARRTLAEGALGLLLGEKLIDPDDVGTVRAELLGGAP